MSAKDPVETMLDGTPRGFSLAFAVFFFVFGIAAGFLIAFTGVGFLEDIAGVIAGVFLGLIALTAVTGIVLFALRKRILRMLFGVAEAEVHQLSAPLSEMAESMALRDPTAAAGSAQRLIRAVLARHAWLSTRRWIMTSLTALIAAMAALAGTALLFKQNALLGSQNERLAVQNTLLEQQTELAEAARNAGFSVEVTEVVGLLGAAASGLDPEQNPGIGDLDRGLVARLVALSQGLRPYRFLDLGLDSADTQHHGRIAVRARRDAVPILWERLAASNGWSEIEPPAALLPQPASPERGYLLRVLVQIGIRDFVGFIARGLDLQQAFAPSLRMERVSMAGIDLALAHLTHAHIEDSDLSGARLPNARFVIAELHESTLSGSDLTGTDFTEAALVGVDFTGSYALAARFDEALLIRPDFTQAMLLGASFRNAVLIAPDWSAAMMAYVDLDGAYVLGEDPLTQIATVAEPFDASLYHAVPVEIGALVDATRWSHHDAELIADLTDGAPAWRLVRLRDFE